MRPILLKGPAIASWLYNDGTRSYVDVDLLADPEQLEQAGEVLQGLGLERLVDERLRGAFTEPHAVGWRHLGEPVGVDLHWRIPGIGADPGRAWERLSNQTAPVEVAKGAEIEALGLPARTLHLSLHAIHDGRGGAQAMRDLQRGVEMVDPDVWRSASRLATELDAAEPFAAGLRLTPGGIALADRLGLPQALSSQWALWGQTPPPGGLRLLQLAEAKGIAAKMRALRVMVAPPAGYIRGHYPSTRSSWAQLASAYLRRPLAGIRQAPAAIRAVRRARAEARSSQLDR